jgi:hypothetical protein
VSRILPARDSDARDFQQPGSPAPRGASQSGSDGNSLTLGEPSPRFLSPENGNTIKAATTDCTGDIMHAEQRQEPLPQAPFDSIAPARTLGKRAHYRIRNDAAGGRTGKRLEGPYGQFAAADM